MEKTGDRTISCRSGRILDLSNGIQEFTVGQYLKQSIVSQQAEAKLRSTGSLLIRGSLPSHFPNGTINLFPDNIPKYSDSFKKAECHPLDPAFAAVDISIARIGLTTEFRSYKTTSPDLYDLD